MYEFIQTPTGWKVFWGPMPAAIRDAIVPAPEQAIVTPDAIGAEPAQREVEAGADEVLNLAV